MWSQRSIQAPQTKWPFCTSNQINKVESTGWQNLELLINCTACTLHSCIRTWLCSWAHLTTTTVCLSMAQNEDQYGRLIKHFPTGGGCGGGLRHSWTFLYINCSRADDATTLSVRVTSFFLPSVIYFLWGYSIRVIQCKKNVIVCQYNHVVTTITCNDDMLILLLPQSQKL